MQIARRTGRALGEREREKGKKERLAGHFFSAAQTCKHWGKSLGKRSDLQHAHTNAFICSSVQKLEVKKKHRLSLGLHMAER